MGGFFPGSKVAKKQVTIPRRPECGACKLLDQCKTPKMSVAGKGGKRILILADKPTIEDDKNGGIFLGSVGRFINEPIEKTGYNLNEDCWFMPVIACRPPKGRATEATVVHCRPLVYQAIKELNPRVVITLGSLAGASIIKPSFGDSMKEYERWIGWKIPNRDPNVWICPLQSPTEIMQEENKHKKLLYTRRFEKQLSISLYQYNKPWLPKEIPDYTKSITIERDGIKAAKMIRKFHKEHPEDKPIAFDYETNSLKPDWADSRIVSCSICWHEEKTLAYPWTKETRAATKVVLMGPHPKIASNMKFEDRWTLKEFGRQVNNWDWDTMLTSHLLDNRRGITSIKFQAYVRLGFPIYDKHIKPFLESSPDSHYNRINQIDLKELLLYNGLDSLLEYLVARDQSDESKWEPAMSSLRSEKAS